MTTREQAAAQQAQVVGRLNAELDQQLGTDGGDHKEFDAEDLGFESTAREDERYDA